MFGYTGEVLWAVAFLFYLFDSAVPISPDSIIIERALNRYQAICIRNPFGAFGYNFYVPNPLQPFSVSLAVRWESARTATPISNEERNSIDSAIRQLLPLRIFSGAVFISCFALAPALAQFFGLSAALLTSIAVVYAINLIQCFILVRARRRYQWTTWQALGACAHFLFCPPYGANVARHRLRHQFDGLDGLDLAMTFDPQGARRIQDDYAEHDLESDGIEPPQRTPAESSGHVE